MRLADVQCSFHGPPVMWDLHASPMQIRGGKAKPSQKVLAEQLVAQEMAPTKKQQAAKRTASSTGQEARRARTAAVAAKATCGNLTASKS